MTHGALSRRAFFGQAAAAPAAGLIPPSEKPRQAWIIVALGWEYNDEFSYHEGEHPQTQLFHEEEKAEAECRRLCEAFFAAETPAEFSVDFESYLPDRITEPDFDEESVTWAELRDAGFPNPYFVLKLTTPEDTAE